MIIHNGQFIVYVVCAANRWDYEHREEFPCGVFTSKELVNRFIRKHTNDNGMTYVYRTAELILDNVRQLSEV